MRVKYGIRRNYTHMIGEDKIVWERFILANQDYFDEVEYDVRVGEGMTMPEDWEEKDRVWAKQLTQKRIDVVGFKGPKIILVEVKRRVDLCTLGQVLGYKFLYEKKENLVEKTESLVIAGLVDRDDRDILEHYGISILVA